MRTLTQGRSEHAELVKKMPVIRSLRCAVDDIKSLYRGGVQTLEVIAYVLSVTPKTPSQMNGTAAGTQTLKLQARVCPARSVVRGMMKGILYPIVV